MYASFSEQRKNSFKVQALARLAGRSYVASPWFDLKMSV
jgi:hypothetical protein